MDAIVLYNLLKPHLEIMDAKEKEFLSNLIVDFREKKSNKRRISLTKAKEKLKYFRNRAAKLEQEKISL